MLEEIKVALVNCQQETEALTLETCKKLCATNNRVNLEGGLSPGMPQKRTQSLLIP